MPGPITRTVTDPQQTGAGDVESGLAQGINTVLSGGANNAVSSTGNSVEGLSSSAGGLVTRQVGVSTFALFATDSSSIKSDTVNTDWPRRR